MNVGHLFSGLLLFLLGGSSFTSAPIYGQQPPAVALVKVQGLQPSYNSCSLVNFSISNVSNQEFYAEVYVEDFDGGSWKVDTLPRNLHEPTSLYHKLVLTKADKLKMGESWQVSYDRCLRPSFVKESKAAFRRAIIEKDANAKSPVLQRIRVDMYIGESGESMLRRKAWSDTFKRIPERARIPMAR